jgi:hypothetical protein
MADEDEILDCDLKEEAPAPDQTPAAVQKGVVTLQDPEGEPYISEVAASILEVHSALQTEMADKGLLNQSVPVEFLKMVLAHTDVQWEEACLED